MFPFLVNRATIFSIPMKLHYTMYIERRKRRNESWKQPQHFRSLKSAHMVANGTLRYMAPMHGSACAYTHAYTRTRTHDACVVATRRERHQAGSGQSRATRSPSPISASSATLTSSLDACLALRSSRTLTWLHAGSTQQQLAQQP